PAARRTTRCSGGLSSAAGGTPAERRSAHHRGHCGSAGAGAGLGGSRLARLRTLPGVARSVGTRGTGGQRGRPGRARAFIGGTQRRAPLPRELSDRRSRRVDATPESSAFGALMALRHVALLTALLGCNAVEDVVFRLGDGLEAGTGPTARLVTSSV